MDNFRINLKLVACRVQLEGSLQVVAWGRGGEDTRNSCRPVSLCAVYGLLGRVCVRSCRRFVLSPCCQRFLWSAEPHGTATAKAETGNAHTQRKQTDRETGRQAHPVLAAVALFQTRVPQCSPQWPAATRRLSPRRRSRRFISAPQRVHQPLPTPLLALLAHP
jgi:hypothetical protein